MSADGLVAYAARRGAEQYCVVGDRRGPVHARVGIPVITPDGRTVAHTADDAFVVVNGRAGPRFAFVRDVALSCDGTRVAYAAEDDAHRAFVVVDHHPGPAFDRVTRPVFSADGRVVAYGARRSGQWLLVSGDRETPVDDEITCVFASADGSRAGAVLADRTVAGRRYDWIGWPAFAPDGRIVHFAARGTAKLVVVGDREIDLGDGVVWDPVLDGATLTFGMRAGRELWRRTLKLW
jgi:hypothetical protein